MESETISKNGASGKRRKRALKIILSKTFFLIFLCSFISACSTFKFGTGKKLKKVKISYSSVFVPEEGGINFVRITTDADAVASPGFDATTKTHATSKPAKSGVSWYKYPVIAVSPDGERIGYITYKNDVTNVMIKSTSQGGGSTQQTFRTDVRGFTFSPDGERVCYTEFRDGNTGIFMMNFNKGTVTQRISPTGSNDNGPSITKDNSIFFDRFEGGFNFGLWSYDVNTGLFSNYSHGYTPCVDPTNNKIIYCARYTFDDNVSVINTSKTTYITNEKSRRSEIWKLDTEKGTEELLLSDRMSSFSSPQVSPDGKWILITGANKSNNGIWNSNIFVIQSNGTRFTQLTYHPGNDMSAVWSADGKSIYFVSQRGTEKGLYNIWRMNFSL